MGRRTKVVGALLLAAAVVVAVASAPAAPAGAGGGSYLRPDREAYQPGDPVHLVAEVYKTERDWLGPYTVFLRRYDPAATSIWYESGHQDPTDVVVGRLVVSRIDDAQVRAEVDFVLPKLADGWWTVDYCNPGCTATLGDLDQGALYVGVLPAAPWPTVAPVTTAVVTVPPLAAVPTTVRRSAAVDADADADADAGSDVVAVDAAAPAPAVPEPVPAGSDAMWWLVGLGAIAVIAVVVIGARRRAGARRTVTSSGRPLDDPPAGSVVPVELEPGRPDDEPIGAGR